MGDMDTEHLEIHSEAYRNNCCVVNLSGSFYNKYGAGKEGKFKKAIKYISGN